MQKLGIIGFGRIGQFHFENLQHYVKDAAILAVADPFLSLEDPRLQMVKHVSQDPERMFEIHELDAIVIASPVETHLPYIEKAVEKGLSVFCEKPLGTDLEQMNACAAIVEKQNAFVQIGFNRRFDPHFASLKNRIQSGEIGEANTYKLTFYDPDLPSLDYLKQSGGIFFDMSIHDFDMVRFLSGAEVESIAVLGDTLIDESLQSIPDIDTAVITMQLTNGAVAVICNSRRATYGYDQRIEVYGAKGMLSASNELADQVVRLDDTGYQASTIKHFFIERYRESYINEFNAFIQALEQKQTSPVTIRDGIASIEIAQLAAKAFNTQQVLKVA